jgi:hypothetical protein
MAVRGPKVPGLAGHRPCPQPPGHTMVGGGGMTARVAACCLAGQDVTGRKRTLRWQAPGVGRVISARQEAVCRLHTRRRQ